MKDEQDGGPAFPSVGEGFGNPLYSAAAGMSLRDYFAIHGDQPGRLEIASAAGVVTQDTCGLPYGHEDFKKFPQWDVWFNTLPQAERLRLYAVVRYQIADAMLKARALPAPPDDGATR